MNTILKMKTPIVMAAFGTTTKAVTTYNYIDSHIRSAFPEHKVIWSYTSHMIKATLQKQNNRTIVSPAEALQQLADQGYQQAVVQSLHFLAGHEFHKLKREVEHVEIFSSLGLPILSSVADYRNICIGLTPLLLSRPYDEALVLIGHGTNHPIWPGFLVLEHFLRDRFADRIFLGCVEHFPTAEEIVDKIVQRGFKKACLIPFMLVAGRHFQRDLLGENPTSWKSLLRSASISVTSINRGMGMEPITSDILISHIQDAMDALVNENSCPR